MNKRGITTLVTIMIAVVVMILALALAGPVKSFVDDASGENTTIGEQGLDCSNSSLSDYGRGTCIITDLYTPVFVGILIGLAGIVIGARLIFLR